METIKIDKTKIKNWTDGDTFALEIKDTNSEYDGRYIILIKYENPEWENKVKAPMFRAKITEKKQIPTLEEIDNLEFVKTHWIHYELCFFPTSALDLDATEKRKLNKNLYPDEYNLLYLYIFTLYISKAKDYQDFIYLGNKKIEFPIEEFKTLSQYEKCTSMFREYLVKNMINYYTNYNLKKSIIYREDNKPEMEKMVKREKEALKRMKEIIAEYRQKE